MEGCVNVNFFWGERIIRRDGDITYSTDPNFMRYVMLGTNYEELKAIVYEIMNISPYHWNVKLSYKYPQIGIGNVVKGYYLAQITSDVDVGRLLSIHWTMQMGLGDVSIFIEAEKIQVEDPYSYGYNTNSQPTQPSYQQEHGTSSQIPEFGTTGWSSYFCGGGSNNEVFQGYAGGSSSQAVQQRQSSEFSQMQEYYTSTDDVELSPPRHTMTGRELALIHENPKYNNDSSSTEDFDEFNSDNSDSEELSKEEAEEVTRTCVLSGANTPRAPWFQTEDYTPVVLSNQAGNYLAFVEEKEDLSIGQIFSDKKLLIDVGRQMHITSNRMYVVVRSNPEQFIAKCVVENCPWRLRVAKRKSHGLFEITKCTEHKCLVDLPTQEHRKISVKFIANLIKPHIMESPNLPVKTIITMVNKEFNHNVKYYKAWRGKQCAIEQVYGNWSTTYDTLPQFMMAMAHANPGSAVVIDAIAHENDTTKSICKLVFWCLKAQMDGWQHARPVISIDGTFLKGKYNGKLLIAMGVDSNNHQYPICYGLVEEESEANWSWFLKLLRQYVCMDRLHVCIISYRAAGILAAMGNPDNGFTPPYGILRFCLFHVRSNFSSKHPGGDLKQLMWLAGSTPQVRKHNAYMKRIGEISLPALQYLVNIDPELWTICYDVGGARYGQATINIMEGFNGNIRMARFLPVTAMMEYIFYKTVTIVNTQRNQAVDAMQQGEQFCRRTNAMITRYMEKAKAHTVKTFSRQHGIFTIVTQRYRVKGGTKGGHKQNVDIRNHTCTCGKWMCHHLPCSHVLTGCLAENLNWKKWIGPYHYSSKLHQLWEPLILPLPVTESWNYVLPIEWQMYGKLVPNEAYKKMKKKRGQNGQSVRFRTEMDQSRSGKKCSRCKQEGHTKRSKLCPRRLDGV